jgi:hypothetical protein
MSGTRAASSAGHGRKLSSGPVRFVDRLLRCRSVPRGANQVPPKTPNRAVFAGQRASAACMLALGGLVSPELMLQALSALLTLPLLLIEAGEV